MNGVPPSPKILVHFHEQLQLKLARGHGKGIHHGRRLLFNAFSAARSATSLPTAAAVSVFVPPEISLSKAEALIAVTRYVINDLRVDVLLERKMFKRGHSAVPEILLRTRRCLFDVFCFIWFCNHNFHLFDLMFTTNISSSQQITEKRSWQTRQKHFIGKIP